MTQVLISLVEIARLRRDPSVLPASIVLLVVMAAAYAGSSAMQSWMLYSDDRLLARTAADLGLTLAVFWILLAAARRPHRYLQTMSAALGTTVLLTPLVLMLFGLRQQAAANETVKLLVGMSSIAVIVWYVLIIGHILRGALEIGFVTGIALAMTYQIASDALLARLFPGAV
ncbi:MAG: hypothetical protein HW417_1448 [Steroidobacteraceae bacterium]|nr:hypothetical protein [Steroidobacteraceae bacterium]